MYLLEYDIQGELEKITPNAPFGMIGAYVDKLPLPIDEMIELGIIEEVVELGITKYKIIGGNE